jgi:hypothetical protein
MFYFILLGQLVSVLYTKTFTKLKQPKCAHFAVVRYRSTQYALRQYDTKLQDQRQHDEYK